MVINLRRIWESHQRLRKHHVTTCDNLILCTLERHLWKSRTTGHHFGFDHIALIEYSLAPFHNWLERIMKATQNVWTDLWWFLSIWYYSNKIVRGYFQQLLINIESSSSSNRSYLKSIHTKDIISISFLFRPLLQKEFRVILKSSTIKTLPYHSQNLFSPTSGYLV